MSDSIPPKRRFGFRAEGGADSRDQAIEMLRHMADEMERNPGLIGSTIGGCSYGGHYFVTDRGDHITPRSFRESLAKWMQQTRGARS